MMLLVLCGVPTPLRRQTRNGREAYAGIQRGGNVGERQAVVVTGGGGVSDDAACEILHVC